MDRRKFRLTAMRFRLVHAQAVRLPEEHPTQLGRGGRGTHQKRSQALTLLSDRSEWPSFERRARPEAGFLTETRLNNLAIPPGGPVRPRPKRELRRRRGRGR